MTNSERLFLLLAEEKNFHRTAKKAFITQQCLSDHIKRLEESYGSVLLTRRPTVELTRSGAALQRTLLQIQGLEQGLQKELAEIAGNTHGQLRIGANHTRTQFFMAEFFQRYHTKFPHVEIEIFSEETAVLKELLLCGKIDLFLGINAKPEPPLKARLLQREQICLVVSPAYLRRYLGDRAEVVFTSPSEVDLAQFSSLPFVLNHSSSTLSAFIHHYFAENNLQLDCRCAITDYTVTAQLCRSGAVAGFCPEFLRPRLLAQNSSYPLEERLLVLPLSQMGHPLCAELIYNELLQYPRYILECFSEIEAIFRESASHSG